MTTVISSVQCAEHKCYCVKRGGLIVCLKCEEERHQRQYSNEPGHAAPGRPIDSEAAARQS